MSFLFTLFAQGMPLHPYATRIERMVLTSMTETGQFVIIPEG